MAFRQPELPEPIGTPDEQQAVGLDPADWYSCAAPDEARGIQGCPVWRECKRAEKGKGGAPVWVDSEGKTVGWETAGANREGPGPLNVGWQLVERRDRKVIVSTGTCGCWELPRRKANGQLGWDGQSNVFLETAVEGERIDISGSEPDDKEIPGTRIWKKKTISYQIKPQPRPHEHPALSNSAFAAEQIQKMQERQQSENIQELFRLGNANPASGDKKKGAGSKG